MGIQSVDMGHHVQESGGNLMGVEQNGLMGKILSERMMKEAK